MREKSFLRDCVLFSIFVLLGFFFVFKSFIWFRDENRKYKKARSQVLEAEEKVVGFAQILETQEQEGWLELVQAALPEEKDFYVLVGLLGQVARDNGFVVVSFQLSPGTLQEEGKAGSKGKKGSDLGQVLAKVELRGPKGRLANFLFDLEHVLPVVSVEKMSSTLSGGAVNLGLNLAVYHLPIPEKLKQAWDLPLSQLRLLPVHWDLLEGLKAFKRYGLVEVTSETVTERERENPFEY